MCRLIVSDIITASCTQARIERIGQHMSDLSDVWPMFIAEKWTAVADICRCLHNYNGVMQVCAAFTNSSVYRLRKTWERVSKTVIDLVVLITLFN